MFGQLHQTVDALRFCNETNVWLNLFCHSVFLLSQREAYIPRCQGIQSELTGYRANNTIIIVIWMFFCIGFPCDFTHATGFQAVAVM